VKRPPPEGQPPQGEPPRTVPPSPVKETETPSSTSSDSSTRSKPGLSPETWEKIGKVLPGIIKAVAMLIDAISKLK
jgi:hypothetical protein